MVKGLSVVRRKENFYVLQTIFEEISSKIFRNQVVMVSFERHYLKEFLQRSLLLGTQNISKFVQEFFCDKYLTFLLQVSLQKIQNFLKLFLSHSPLCLKNFGNYILSIFHRTIFFRAAKNETW